MQIARVARAPGRVTLIGDHTDYNQGVSLPMAIGLATEATFAPKAGTFLVGVASDQFPEQWELPLGGPPPHIPESALAARLVQLAKAKSGGTIAVTSTIPVGAGLASSAAFSVALLLALGCDRDPVPLARLCQEAEAAARWRVGLLDPWVIAGAQAGHALSIDFATLESHKVAVPEEAAFVVVHSGTSRKLDSSPYAARRAECDMAANHIGQPLGRCTLDDLSALSEPVLRRRARHVITECARVREVERLLARGNLVGVGAVMTDGHHSLAGDFRVSVPAVDELVDRLIGMPGVYGARMTGGGFGGCVIALCDPDSPALEPTSHAALASWRVGPAGGAEVRSVP